METIMKIGVHGDEDGEDLIVSQSGESPEWVCLSTDATPEAKAYFGDVRLNFSPAYARLLAHTLIRIADECEAKQ